MKKKIRFYHLLNDFSGSPNVLKDVVQEIKKKDWDIIIHTSTNEGFLSQVGRGKMRTYSYSWSTNKWITLFRFLSVQLKLFLQLLFSKDVKGTIVYINTLLPFGPALAAKVRGAKVIYHVHESYIKPLILQRFLTAVVKSTASKVIFVSKYLKSEYPSLASKSSVIYNALSEEFIQNAEQNVSKTIENILMVSSLKVYKGVDEYVNLALMMPHLKFSLVLNATDKEVSDYFPERPPNLSIFGRQKKLHLFYKQADLLMNMTIPELCKESFGLTVLEAKAYGLPSIVPPAGGPLELIENGVDGFILHPRNQGEIGVVIDKIDSGKYRLLKENTKRSFEQFSTEIFKQSIADIFFNL